MSKVLYDIQHNVFLRYKSDIRVLLVNAFGILEVQK